MYSKELLKKVKNLNFPAGKYALFGSAPLGIRDIREIGDVDIIVARDLWNALKNDANWKPAANGLVDEVLRKGNFEVLAKWAPGEWDIEKLIQDAEIIEGLPFVRLEHVMRWKKIYSREKDLKDIEVIEEYLQKKKI